MTLEFIDRYIPYIAFAPVNGSNPTHWIEFRLAIGIMTLEFIKWYSSVACVKPGALYVVEEHLEQKIVSKGGSKML